MRCSLTGSREGSDKHGDDGQQQGGEVQDVTPDDPKQSGDGSPNQDVGGHGLVPNSPEARYREVLSIPVISRPLFPGVIMPVMVQDNRVIKELIDIRKQGYARMVVLSIHVFY